MGCSGGDSPDTLGEPFGYATLRDLSVNIQVTIDGAPAPSVRVQIADVLRVDANGNLPESLVSGSLYFAGLTGQDGRVVGELRLPEIVGEVAVVAHVPGTSGLYSEPLLRSAWGPFAPSARLHVAASVLGNLDLALTTN